MLAMHRAVDFLVAIHAATGKGIFNLATGQTKDAFAHFRNLRAVCPRKVSPILDDHGNLISDKAAIAHRWKNHSEQLLNHPSVPCPDLPSTVQEEQRTCQEPSELEVHTAVRKLKNGKVCAV